MAKKVQEKMSRRGKVGLAVAVLVLLVAVSCVFIVDRQAISDRLAAFGFEPTAEIEAISGRIGLTDRAKRVLYATGPSVESGDEFNAKCEAADTSVYILGCYSGGKIFIFDVQNEELDGIKEVTMAHELLHAVYERMSDNAKDRVNEGLESVYAENPELEGRMKYYDSSSHYTVDNRYNELHSIIGTEILELPESLEQHYARFFKSRSGIVEIFDGYNEKFVELRERADELLLELESLTDEINLDSADYSDGVDELNDLIEDFNRRAGDGYFLTDEDFQAERTELVVESNRLAAFLAEINGKIERYNVLLEEYNEVSLRVKDLNNSIDSTYEPVPSV